MPKPSKRKPIKRQPPKGAKRGQSFSSGKGRERSVQRRPTPASRTPTAVLAEALKRLQSPQAHVAANPLAALAERVGRAADREGFHVADFVANEQLLAKHGLAQAVKKTGSHALVRLAREFLAKWDESIKERVRKLNERRAGA